MNAESDDEYIDRIFDETEFDEVEEDKTKKKMREGDHTLFVVSTDDVFDLHADFLTREGVEVYARGLEMLIAIHFVEFRAIQSIVIGNDEGEKGYEERVYWRREGGKTKCTAHVNSSSEPQ